MITLYTWEFSLLVMMAIAFFFVIMILRKQMEDFFGFNLNIMIALPSTLLALFVLGMIFGLKIGFWAGVVGLVVGIAMSFFVEGEGGGGDGEYY